MPFARSTLSLLLASLLAALGPACSEAATDASRDADAMLSCEGGPSALAAVELGGAFFRDDYVALGLEEARARRVTFGDVNGDGIPDFIAIATGVTPGLQRLYVGVRQADGEIVYRDDTERSGIWQTRAGEVKQTALMVAFADVDNDGDLDLFQGSYSQASSGDRYVGTPNELYLNDGTGRFSLKLDAGVDEPWPLTTAAATFLDFDKDGIVDLYVGAFMKDYPKLASYQDELYRGNGDGTFVRVTEAAGLATPGPIGGSAPYAKPTYGVTACDVDGDGWQDVLVSTYALFADDHLRNEGDGTFTNVARASRFAEDDQAHPTEPRFRQGGNGFAAACADYDNDGDLDVFKAETTHGDYPRSTADRSGLLRNTGAAGGYTFERPALEALGLRRANLDDERGNEGDHGAAWLDFDNDGLLDLVIEQSAYPGSHAYLFHQKPDHTFEDVTEASGVLAAMVNANGLSVDDVDRDGDLDILMGSVDAGGVEPPGGAEHVHVYRNQIGAEKAFLHVTLRGRQSNAQGIGARVVVTAGCVTQTREIIGGRGTFGATDPAYAHFGLGDATRVDRLEIVWPTNPPTVQVFSNLPVRKFVEVTEGLEALELTAPAAPR